METPEPQEADRTIPLDAEDSLATKVRFYEAFFSHTEDLLYMLDLRHRFIYANKALLTVWGMPWKEVRGKDFYQMGYGVEMADFLCAELDRVAETGEPRRGEVPYTGTPGLREYEYVFSPIFAADGKVEAVSGITRDITERVEAEKGIAVLDELSWKLAPVTVEDEIIRVATEVLGTALACDRCYFMECFEVEDLITVGLNWTRPGTTTLAGTHRLFDFGGREWWQQCSGGDFSVEDIHTHPLTMGKSASYDSSGVCSYMAQPFRQDGCRTVAMVATESAPRVWTPQELRLLENVTARVWPLVEQARETAVRQKLLEDLRMADERKDRFLATLAHELRNPLAPVLTGMAVIEASAENPELIRNVSEMVQRQVSYMVDLIDDLLEISRIKTGKIVLKKSDQRLSSILLQAEELAAPSISARRQKLVLERPDGDAVIHADASRIGQIVSNLLSNASRYSPEASRITLSWGMEDADVWIRVKDEGKGIEPQEVDAIFELFHQSRVGDSQGLGIGLSLVKTLVSLHGGTVSVTSAGQDQGSEFTVHLPACVVSLA